MKKNNLGKKDIKIDKFSISKRVIPKGISVVVPCFNEGESIPLLMAEIAASMDKLEKNVLWECIWIDDGSTDDTWQVIRNQSTLTNKKANKGLRLQVNSGQTTAIAAGISMSKFDWIITLDGDGQNDPADIPMLVRSLKTDCDVICGKRYDRKDHFIRRKLPSRIANKIVRMLFKVSVSDIGCTLRLFNKKLLKGIVLSGEMHRTLTIYLKLNGGRLVERAVNHRPRIHGKSKYGSERIFKFIGDLILAKSYVKSYRSPIYLFGGTGFILSMVVALLSLLYISKIGVLLSIYISLISFFILETTFMSIGIFAQMILGLHLTARTNKQLLIRDSFGLSS